MKALEAVVAWLASARPVIWLYNPQTPGDGMSSPRTLTALALTPVLIWIAYRYYHNRPCTRSVQSDWTVTLDQEGSLTTEHRAETTENGKKLSQVHTTDTSPYTPRARRGLRNDDVGGGQQLERHQPMSGAVTRMQRTTQYTTRDSRQAEAMAKNDAESEKKQMDITRSIMDMLASRDSSTAK